MSNNLIVKGGIEIQSPNSFGTYSLVTKDYVNSTVSSQTQSLSDTLSDGSDTGTYSIVLNSSSLIQSESGNESISLPNDYTIVLTATGSLQHNSSLTNVTATTYVNVESSTSNSSSQTIYSLSLPNDRIISIDCIFTGLDVSGSQGYFNKITGSIKNIGGALSTIGGGLNSIEEKDFATASASIETTGTDVNFVVQGEVATDINWSVRFNYQILK